MGLLGAVQRYFLLMSSLGIESTRGLPALEENEKKEYSGYKVLSVLPKSETQTDYLSKLHNTPETDCGQLSWWSDAVSGVGIPVTVAVPPSCATTLEEELETEGLQYNVTIKDLGEMIREEREYREFSKLHWANTYNWSPEYYHNLQEIEQRMQYMADTYPHLITKKKMTTTYEGRSIWLLVLREQGPREKPVIWIDCGIHAREWVSPPACLYAIDRLVQDSNSVNPRENLLAVYDFYIMPMANPDGYVYSWTKDRMWRKNRRPLNDQQSVASPVQPGFGGAGGVGGGWGAISGGWPGREAREAQGVEEVEDRAWGQWGSQKCQKGVDPNRNFPTDWNRGSDNKCDDSFHGDSYLTEAESIAIQKGVEEMRDLYGINKVAAFVSIHAYSQFWMSPYGYTNRHSKDYADHMKVMRKSVDALAKVAGTKFTYGPISEIIYVASGSSVDWAYENMNIKYSFGLELRDTGRRGFMLPQEEIMPTVRETWAGLTAMAWSIATEFGVDKVL